MSRDNTNAGNEITKRFPGGWVFMYIDPDGKEVHIHGNYVVQKTWRLGAIRDVALMLGAMDLPEKHPGLMWLRLACEMQEAVQKNMQAYVDANTDKEGKVI